MISSPLHFYPASSPGQTSSPALPLARYLPILPPGMVSAWLEENIPPGSWLLDPLGATPALALEAARAGYRVIVASNNPILSFMLEILSSAPRSSDFQSTVAELALTRRGEERLDRHIQSLYQTQCSRCGETITAQAYLWRKGENQPYARLAHCPKCGEDGEQPVTSFDLERLNLPGSDTLHRSRALQRVIMNEDEYREDVEQALSCFLPRPLYVLFTLLNKMEGLSLPPERARLLQALLLSTFDAGSTLSSGPNTRSRPRQLIIPAQFRENNLWDVLEGAVSEWAAPQGVSPVAFTRWPELPPPQGGICLFRGRVKSLMPLPEALGPQAVLTAFPRPNQAFWTLSALWSGWLWGREAALPLRSVLDRRRYDWNWHTSALHSVLAAFGRTVPAHIPFFGLLPELAPGFLTAVLAANEAAGLHLAGLALQAEDDFAQGVWFPSGPAAKQPAMNAPVEQAPPPLETTARQAIRATIAEQAEPLPYITLYTAGMTALAQSGVIPESMPGMSGELFTSLQTVLVRSFSDRSFLKLYPAAAERPNPAASETGEDDRGWWWLAGAATTTETPVLPLSDRVEMEVVRFLQKSPACTLCNLQQAIYPAFPGLLTPSTDFLRACLSSYAELSSQPPGSWRIRPGETPAERRADLRDMRAALQKIGEQLGYTVQSPGETSLTWAPGNSAPDWIFYLMASSVVSRYVFAQPAAGLPANRVLVIPGGRARLLAFKLHRNPHLAEAMQGWQVLKFRHLREIAQEVDAAQLLTLTAWETRLSQDPLTEEATQMALFK